MNVIRIGDNVKTWNGLSGIIENCIGSMVELCCGYNTRQIDISEIATSNGKSVKNPTFIDESPRYLCKCGNGVFTLLGSNNCVKVMCERCKITIMEVNDEIL